MAQELKTPEELLLYLKVHNLRCDNNSIRKKPVRNTVFWTFTYLGRRYELTPKGELVRA